MKPILFIISAGSGKRMGVDYPKALLEIDGVPNISNTIAKLGSSFNNIYVVHRVQDSSIWQDWLSKETAENIILVPITSGRGDGHALHIALQTISDKNRYTLQYKDLYVCWGDVYFKSNQIIQEMEEYKLGLNCVAVVPGNLIDNPYVGLQTDGDRIVCAKFSKLGEDTGRSYHDQSIFKFDSTTLMNCLTDLHVALDKNGTYITTNGELSTLYLFHYLYNRNFKTLVYQTGHPTMSYNTALELKNIQSEVKN